MTHGGRRCTWSTAVAVGHCEVRYGLAVSIVPLSDRFVLVVPYTRDDECPRVGVAASTVGGPYGGPTRRRDAVATRRLT